MCTRFLRKNTFLFISLFRTKNKSNMKRKHLLIFVINVIAIMSGCNNRHDYIEKALQKMQSRPINLCLDKMQCRVRNMDTVIVDSMKPDLRFVVYVDSSECSPCALDRMYMWNDLIDEAKRYDGRLKYVFIVAPRSTESLVDIYLSIENSGLKNHVYIDTAYAFKSANREFPKDSKFHQFLLSEHDSILFVGNPLDSKGLEDIYKREIMSIIKY